MTRLNRTIRLLGSFALTISIMSSALAEDSASLTIQPRALHDGSRMMTVPDTTPINRMVIKFADGAGLSYSKSGSLSADRSRFEIQGQVVRAKSAATNQGLRANYQAVRRDVDQVNDWLDQVAGKAAPLIPEPVAELRSQRKSAEQKSGRQLADLASYVSVAIDPNASRQQLNDVVSRINQLPTVEIAYLEPVAIPASFDWIILPPPDPYSCSNLRKPRGLGDLTGFQGYKGPPPTGVNTAAANFVPGGQGQGVRVIDIESGYRKHADLPALFQTIGHTYPGTSAFYAYHGTATLGVIGAKDNGWGTTGIAPESSMGMRSIYNSNLHNDWADAMNAPNNVAWNIYWAGKHALGGVVLIELQRSGPEEVNCPCSSNCSLVPVEYWPADFDAIQSAIANGATVVEPAGNGGRSLDHPVLNGAFNQDSGAIMVSGSASDGVTPVCPGNTQAPNFGSRIDVHSWSEDVATTGKPGFGGNIIFEGDGSCFDYTHSYSGTSSASAIVAGVATVLNAVYREEHGSPPDPLLIRQIMRDTGSPQLPGPIVPQDIGTHPDIGAAIQAIQNL